MANQSVRWMMVLFAAAVQTVSAGRFCGDQPVVWRNDNMTCPVRAVCADVFTGERNWRNGTRCESRRTISNCLCPGNAVCPVGDASHRLFASSSHEYYTCQPVCTLPYCNNIPDIVTRSGKIERPTSVEMVQDHADFDNRNFYRMKCRCPGHHFPGTDRTVKINHQRYDFATGESFSMYTCDTPPRFRAIGDPCSA